MRACNYDFAHDNSHSSDLNVVPPLCEDNIFDEVLSLHLERERDRTIHLHQRTPHSPPPPPPPARSLPSPVDLGGWQALSSRRQVQRTRRITEGYGRPLKRFGGLSISSASSRSENKDSAARDAALIRWSRGGGRRLRTFARGQ